MRHRSPRPILDVLKHPSPRAVRRGALAASAVVALGTATGVVLTSTEGPVSEGDVPHAQAAPTERVTPTSSISADRTDQPSRAASRTAGKALRRPHKPSPTAPTTSRLPGVGDLPSLPSSSAPAAPSSSAPTSSAPAARRTSSAPAPSPSRTHSSSSSPSPSPSQDDTVPETTARTVSLVDGVWTVVMGADEAARFECSVDGGAWSACSPTDTFVLTQGGPHSLAVRATDTSGNTDPTPAQLTVKVTGSALGLG
jgi:hypothetical protein